MRTRSFSKPRRYLLEFELTGHVLFAGFEILFEVCEHARLVSPVDIN